MTDVGEVLTSTAEIGALLSFTSDSALKTELLKNECTARYQSDSGSSSPQHEEREQEGVTFDVIDDLDNMWDVLEVLDERPVTVDLDVRHAGAAGVELTPTTPPQSTAAAAPATPAKNARPKAKRTHASCDAAAPPPGDADAASPAERDASGDGTDGVDAYEEKRLKRMRRNRESAAMSRNRKKAHMEELEAKVNELSATVARLEAENARLKAENAQNARLGGPASGPPPAAAAAAAAAPGPAAVGKKVGAASLALMSALTFVALTGTPMGGLPTIASRHVPGARALMSLPEERSVGFGARAAPAVAPGNAAAAALLSAETAPLWPALHAAASAGAAASEPAVVPVAGPAAQPALLPSPADRTREASTGAALAPAVLMAAPPIGADRVIRLPQNSSWADALRTEAAEREASELAAAASARRRAGSKLLAWPAQSEQRHVYEPDWKDEEDDDEEATLGPDDGVPPLPFAGTGFYDDGFADGYAEARRRFIFCSRAYTFDVDGRGGAGVASPVVRRGDVAERPNDKHLPAAMPARFRHAASQKMPMAALTDGSNTTAELPAAPEPVVSLLLPSAALHGVVTVADSERRPSSRAEDEIPGLVQVTCQLLNATRWS